MDKPANTLPASLFDRFVVRQRSVRRLFGLTLGLFALPLAAVALDNAWAGFLYGGVWRVILLPPVIVLYVLIIAPILDRTGAQAVQSMRSLAQGDSETFDQLVEQATYVRPAHEVLAFSLGAVFGILSALSGLGDRSFTWLKAYWILANLGMYGLLVLTIFVSASSTRLNDALRRCPLNFDILDPAPFDMIGRQSLLIALVFVGGITISTVFVFPRQDFRAPIVWISYIALILVTLLIFFMSMRPTHQMMVAEKVRRLDPVQQRIRQIGLELSKRMEQRQAVGELADELSALSLFEQRLLAARTWPYDMDTLRTLFVSILIPLFTVLARVVAEIYFR